MLIVGHLFSLSFLLTHKLNAELHDGPSLIEVGRINSTYLTNLPISNKQAQPNDLNSQAKPPSNIHNS